MNIGICFGGYCPMHQGHLDAIMRAKKENDVVYVVVCGYDNEPRAEQLGIDLDKRYQLVKEFFKDDEIINIIKVNDTELGIDESMSKGNWIKWLRCVSSQIESPIIFNPKHELDNSYIVRMYVGEQRYYDDLYWIINKTGFFKNHWFLPFDHIFEPVLIPKEIEISGTLVRENPLKYWSKIVKPFRKFLTKNILVIGTASEGKTTLVRDIAKYFDIPHIEEYGRTYMAQHNMLDTDLTCHDFTEFLFHQRQELLETEESDANNKGVVISDTDNFITLMYCKAYSEDSNINFTEEEFESLKTLVRDHLTKGVYWDKIFIIPPGNKFVNDGTRYMKQSSMDERTRNYHTLLHLINQICPDYMEKMVELIPGNYYHNFVTVKDYINGLLNS